MFRVDRTGTEAIAAPVFDFDAKSSLEAYLENRFAESQGGHHESPRFGGMNHDMVIYPKGVPPRKCAKPPKGMRKMSSRRMDLRRASQDVDFVRFVAMKWCASRP